LQTDTHISSSDTIIYSKAKSFIKLTKFTLSALVVFSAIVTFFTVAETHNWKQVLAICLGGFLVTAAANGFNQIIEKDLDKLMHRTKLRPIPTGNLTVNQAFVICAIFGIIGTIMLWVFTNPLSGIIGFVSIILYALVYTPLKRVTPFSVFIGAIPGALPTLIGAIAATDGFGHISFFAILLFCIQFFWQFPHFWAIAWVAHADYNRAGFKLLPSKQGPTKFTALQAIMYALVMIPIGMLPYIYHVSGYWSMWIVLTANIFMVIQCVRLYIQMDVKAARRVMFSSYVYLPIILLALLANKL